MECVISKKAPNLPWRENKSAGLTGRMEMWTSTSPCLGVGTSASTTSTAAEGSSILNAFTWTTICFFGAIFSMGICSDITVVCNI